MERPVGYMDSSPSSAEGSAAPAAPAAAGRTPAVPAEHQALLSRELGPELEILSLLGQGRAARVYLGRDHRLDRLVAVKVLSRTLADDAIATARFQREARAAAALEHPNAVAVYRTGLLSDQAPYLVMQYVAGGTLESRLAAEGPLPEGEARRILADVAAALAEAHRHGFVHRDLRPENVLCDDTRSRALVSDFGLTGVLPEARRGDARLTGVGEVLSSLEYASPELLRGAPLTEAVDIYALGIMGYHLLSGAGPFQGRSGAALAAAHLAVEPRPLTDLCPTVSPELADVLHRCLSKDPARRPRAAHLARILAERPATAGVLGAPRGGLLGGLLQRRLPQTVMLTAAVGWALQEFVGNQVDLGFLPPRAYGFTWASVLCGVAAAGVIGWFHGPKGRQRVTLGEVALLVVIALLWLAAGVFILSS
jgi:tRNA A-37 threonylcarbamoyl transferase component Bud32